MIKKDSNPAQQVREAFYRHPYSWNDLLPFVGVLAAYLLAGDYLALGSQVIIMIVFALSLDLVLGYGGIPTLGHAALFGMGAYAAGLFAKHVSGEPLMGFAVACGAGALTALLTGPIVLRSRGITLVMLTLAVSTMLLELANSWQALTGGADGLYGLQIAPLLGRFEFDLWGHVAYWYSAGVMAAAFVLCKIVVNSPFGLIVRGMRENPARMRLLGVPVTKYLVLLYGISGLVAGAAGGLTAQVTQLVGLDAFSFVLSGNVLIMLILGGTGSLYGAIVGATVFVILADRAASVSPFHWLFALGIVLIVTVRYAPDGLVGVLSSRRFSFLYKKH
ncbi:MAG: branched-chain amino acid ABC transporter permease [Xanthobacteraceae bacterium]